MGAVLDERRETNEFEPGERAAAPVRVYFEPSGCRGLERGPELADLTTATRVRDIGMTTVPDEIITKDGPLDDDEWAVIRMHPERSADMLDPAPAFARVRAIVRASHEHIDGSGYPHSLAGERIPMGARILLAVESYLAMTADHPYGGMLSPEDGLERIQHGVGCIYDPRVVSALAAAVAPDTASV